MKLKDKKQKTKKRIYIAAEMESEADRHRVKKLAVDREITYRDILLAGYNVISKQHKKK